MKLTKSKLQQMIKEELGGINEATSTKVYTLEVLGPGGFVKVAGVFSSREEAEIADGQYRGTTRIHDGIKEFVLDEIDIPPSGKYK